MTRMITWYAWAMAMFALLCVAAIWCVVIITLRLVETMSRLMRKSVIGVLIVYPACVLLIYLLFPHLRGSTFKEFLAYPILGVLGIGYTAGLVQWIHDYKVEATWQFSKFFLLDKVL